MRKKLLPILFSLINIFFYSSCLADEYYDFYVDNSFSGTEKGTDEEPFKSLKKALEQAEKNITEKRRIFVKNGNYKEDTVLGDSVKLHSNKNSVFISGKILMKNNTELKNIVIEGENSALTTEESGSETLIEGIEVRNSALDLLTALPGNGKIVIKNSVFKNGKKGIYIQSGRSIELENNFFIDNREEGIDLREGVSGSIVNNNINNNGEGGIEFVANRSSLTITKNSLIKNGSSGITAQFYAGLKGKNKIYINGNRIISNHNYGINCQAPSGGKPKKQYFRNSIKNSNNYYKKNGKKISKKCF